MNEVCIKQGSRIVVREATVRESLLPSKLMRTFGDRLRHARTVRKLSQRQVAAIMRARGAWMEQTQYSLYENNKRTPKLESLRQLCLVLGVSSDYLLGID